MPRISGGSISAGGFQSVQIQVDQFITPGAATWTKPSWAKRAIFKLLSGQNGGASGRRGAAASLRFGGGSAGAPTYTEYAFSASELPATGNITVGTAGVGGAAVTVDNTDGNPGTAGGNTLCDGPTGVQLVARASSGVPGGGTATAGTAGSAQAGLYAAIVGAASSTSAAPTTPNSNAVATAAGAGGGIDAADVARAGGAAGFIGMISTPAQSVGGVVGGALPTAGQLLILAGGFLNHFSGGGGAASTTAAAQAGGFGGGGGGASVNGFNSGAGGNGTPGAVVIVWEG